MDLEKISALVKLIEESSFREFTYSDEDVEISLSKEGNVPPAPGWPPMPFFPMQDRAPAAAPAQASSDLAKSQDEEAMFINSPIVGTFYSAPSPEAPAYVRVGDKLKEGDTVCILEAMKMMNEIQCEFDCEIEAILVSNEQKVEYGQPLFRVKKI